MRREDALKEVGRLMNDADRYPRLVVIDPDCEDGWSVYELEGKDAVECVHAFRLMRVLEMARRRREQ